MEVQEEDADKEFRRVTTVQDPRATVEGLTPGASFKVRVVAVNGAGASVPSGVVEAQTPKLADVA